MARKLSETIRNTYQKLYDIQTLRDAMRARAAGVDPSCGPTESPMEPSQFDEEIAQLRQKINADLAVLLDDLDKDLGSKAREDLPIFDFGEASCKDAPDQFLLSQIETARPLAPEVFVAEQELLKQISIRHIKEEMDSLTYHSRVESGFSRLVDASKLDDKRIVQRSGPNGQSPPFLKKVDDLLAILKDNIPQEWLLDHPNRKPKFDAMEGRLTAIRNLLLSCQAFMAKGVPEFCSPDNRGYVRAVTAEAAAKAEKVGWASLLVLAAAATSTLLANHAISESGNFPQMEYRAYILTAVFIATLVFSSYVGSRFREAQIARLNRQMRTAFTGMLALGVRLPRPARGDRSMAARWFRLLGRLNPRRAERQFQAAGDSRFPVFMLDWFREDISRNASSAPVGRFAVGRQIDWSRNLILRAGVLGINAAAMGVIYLGLAGSPTTFALSKNDNPRHVLIGRAADGRACVIAQGNVIRVTDRDLTLRASSNGANASQPIRAIIDRNLVQRIVRVHPDGAESCDVPQPIVVKHQGDIGGAGSAGMVSVPDSATDVSAIASTLQTGFAALNASLQNLPPPSTPTLAPVFLLPAAAPETGLPVINIFVDGTQLTQDGERNAMLLPLFRTPVLGLETGGPLAAYNYGRRSLASGTEDSDRVSAFLAALFQPLYQCVASGATLDLDVVGFASTSWQEPGSHEVTGLNVELAEGRRAALIERLWAGMTDHAASHRIRIMDAAGALVPLDQMIGADLLRQRRFVGDQQGTASAKMTEHLLKFVADTQRGQLSEGLRELLSRSAVIQILGTSDRDCLGGPVVQAKGGLNSAPNMNELADLSIE